MPLRDVLEEKLQRILEEFGVDKLADVLDPRKAALGWTPFFQAVLSPKKAEKRATALAEEIRQKAEDAGPVTRPTSTSRPAVSYTFLFFIAPNALVLASNTVVAVSVSWATHCSINITHLSSSVH